MMNVQILLLLPILGSCLSIFFEDLRSRSISILWPFLIMIFGILAWTNRTPSSDPQFLLQNILYLVAAFSLTLFWLWRKKIGFIQAFKKNLGIGDIVVSFILTPFFSFPEFVLLFLFTSVWGLCLFGVSAFKTNIPFAGLLGLGSVLILIFRLVSVHPFTLIPS